LTKNDARQQEISTKNESYKIPVFDSAALNV